MTILPPLPEPIRDYSTMGKRLLAKLAAQSRENERLMRARVRELEQRLAEMERVIMMEKRKNAELMVQLNAVPVSMRGKEAP